MNVLFIGGPKDGQVIPISEEALVVGLISVPGISFPGDEPYTRQRQIHHYQLKMIGDDDVTVHVAVEQGLDLLKELVLHYKVAGHLPVPKERAEIFK
jgi:hypothetical protein